jgi:outer membrane immunogenic protein
MKKLLLATTILAFGPAAFAADLPVKAPITPPVAVQPAFNWTGCYVGAHAGGGWGSKAFSDPSGAEFAPTGEEVSAKTKGWLAGLQTGCNYQFARNWVVGIDADFSWAHITGSANDPFFNSKNDISFNAKTDYLASVAGRLGYTWDRWMLYGKGGAAWAHDKYNMTSTGVDNFSGSATETRTGWIAGAGVEWAFQQNWSAKLEYDHYGLGQRSVSLTDGVSSIDADVKQRIDVVKVGINYRF